MSTKNRERLLSFESVSINVPIFKKVEVVKDLTRVKISQKSILNSPRIFGLSTEAPQVFTNVIQAPKIESIRLVTETRIRLRVSTSAPKIRNITLNKPVITEATTAVGAQIKAKVGRLRLDYPALKSYFSLNPSIGTFSFNYFTFKERLLDSKFAVKAIESKLVTKQNISKVGLVSFLRISPSMSLFQNLAAVSIFSKKPQKRIENKTSIRTFEVSKIPNKGLVNKVVFTNEQIKFLKKSVDKSFVATESKFEITKTTHRYAFDTIAAKDKVGLGKPVKNTIGINSSAIAKFDKKELPSDFPRKVATSSLAVKKPIKAIFNTTILKDTVLPGRAIKTPLIFVSSVAKYVTKGNIKQKILLDALQVKKPLKVLNSNVILGSRPIPGRAIKTPLLFTSTTIKTVNKVIPNDLIFTSKIVKDVKKPIINNLSVISKTIPGLLEKNTIVFSDLIVKKAIKQIPNFVGVSNEVVKDVKKVVHHNLITTSRTVLGLPQKNTIVFSDLVTKKTTKQIPDFVGLINEIAKDVTKEINITNVAAQNRVVLGKIAKNIIRTENLVEKKASISKDTTVGISVEINISSALTLPVNFAVTRSSTLLGIPIRNTVRFNNELRKKVKAKRESSIGFLSNTLKLSGKNEQSKITISTHKILPAYAWFSKDTTAIKTAELRFFIKKGGINHHTLTTSILNKKPIKAPLNKVSLINKILPAYAIFPKNIIASNDLDIKNVKKKLIDTLGLNNIIAKNVKKPLASNTLAISNVLPAYAIFPKNIVASNDLEIKDVIKKLIDTLGLNNIIAKNVKKPLIGDTTSLQSKTLTGIIPTSREPTKTAISTTLVKRKAVKGIEPITALRSILKKEVVMNQGEDTVGLVNSGLLSNQDYVLNYFDFTTSAYVGESRVLN